MELSKKARNIKPSSTLSISAKAKELKEQGMDVIGLGVGEPDFDTPLHIKEAAIAAICDGETKYTAAAGTIELRKAVCGKLKRENDLCYDFSQIVITNGAKHALINSFMAILNEGDEVIIPSPFWLSYAEMVKIAGGVPVFIKTKKENRFMVSKEQLENAYSPKTKALILTSPSNPTGMVCTKEELQMIADFAVEKDIFVISDEIYEHLIYDEDKKHISIASLNEEIYKRTIVINGVSKSYAMTGWRIGFSASCKEVASLMASLQSHMASNANSIAQKAALAALSGPQNCVEQMRLQFKKRRDYIFEREEAIPYISALKPEGAFYLFIDISKLYGMKYESVPITSATEFASMLLDKKCVAVVPCADFGMDDHIRISYATSMENIKEGMDRLEAFIQELTL